MSSEADIMQVYDSEIHGLGKRRPRRAPWGRYEGGKGQESPGRHVTPAPGLQRMDRGAAMELLRRTLGEGQLELVAGFGWVCRIAPDAGIASQADILKELMGTWLGKIAPWDAFASWTFSRPVNVDGAMYVARRHLRWVEKRAGVPVYACVLTERGDTGGLVHLHALIGNMAHLRFYCHAPLPPDRWGVPCCLVHAWPAGYARVLRYDPALGAKHYVSKYVVKRLAEWELWGFPATPQLPLKNPSAK